MTQVVVAVGTLLLVLPGWFDRHHREVDPGRRARAYRSALLLGLVAVLGGSLLWAAPFGLHLADRWGFPGLCDGVVHGLALGGFELALIASVGGAVLVVRVVGALTQSSVRGRAARVDPLVGDHRAVSEFDVVVIASERLIAVGVPGDRPQIVVTDCLVAALEPDEFDAVLRHEIAHHRLGHRSYLILASAVDQTFGWFPGVPSSTAALADALEEWADLASTGRAPERVARLRSALDRLAALHVTTSAQRAFERRLGNLDRSPVERRARAGRDVGLAVGLGGAVGMMSLAYGVADQFLSSFRGCVT